MRTTDNIYKKIKNLNVTASGQLDNKINDCLNSALAENKKQTSAAHQPNIWTIIMKSKITKFAVAAAIIIAALLSIAIFDESIPTAYAIEQTIEANGNITYFHFKYYNSINDQNTVAKEAWVAYDNDNISNVRVNYTSAFFGYDMVQVWNYGSAKQWEKNQKTLTYINDSNFSDKIVYFGNRFNPRGAIEYLLKREEKGEMTTKIQEPSNKNSPIIVTADYEPNTYLIGKDLPAFREVFSVDNNSKLINSVEIYEFKNGEYVERGIWKYCDYNKPFDKQIFNIESELPEDILEIYHYGIEGAGLEQGELDEKQIVTEVVRQFFEALIDKDFALAGNLFGGMPAEEIEEKFGNLNIIQIVSIAEPISSKYPDGYRVPCLIKINKEGQIVDWQPVAPLVRKPNRWIIVGGIK